MESKETWSLQLKGLHRAHGFGHPKPYTLIGFRAEREAGAYNGWMGLGNCHYLGPC